MMSQVIGAGLLPADPPWQFGPVPDAVERRPATRGGDLIPGGGDEEGLPGRAELFARCPAAGGQDLDDRRSQGQSATAVALGPQHLDVALIQVDTIGREQPGLPGPQTTRVHQGEERACLPPPRRLRVKACGCAEEPLDLSVAQQVGVGRDEPGFPLIRQHVGIAVSVRGKPPAEVADVGHPRPIAAVRVRQLRGDPALDGLPVEDPPIVGGAVGVEALQVPDPGGPAEAHLLLEHQVGLQFGREGAGEAVGAHDRPPVRAPSGTSRTHWSSRASSTLMYWLVDSGSA